MGDLSKNFSRSEFTCPCCGRVITHRALIASLQRMRDVIGDSIYVTSGYRCPEYNLSVGGAVRSFHIAGKAADIWAADLGALFDVARIEFAQHGLGIYPDASFIHVDVRDYRARWGRLGGDEVAYEQAMPKWLDLLKGGAT